MINELKEKLRARENKRKLLFSLLVNTHCAGCGKINYVCFWGYCGEYCDKGCWKYFHDDWNSAYDEEESFRLWWIYEKYKDLDNVNLRSNARRWRTKNPYNEGLKLSIRKKDMMSYNLYF
jgi:hypothetical protein